MPAALTEHVKTCPTCQFVKADHLPPAGLRFPLPVPSESRWGGCISLDFLKLLLRGGGAVVMRHEKVRDVGRMGGVNWPPS